MFIKFQWRGYFINNFGLSLNDKAKLIELIQLRNEVMQFYSIELENTNPSDWIDIYNSVDEVLNG